MCKQEIELEELTELNGYIDGFDEKSIIFKLL